MPAGLNLPVIPQLKLDYREHAFFDIFLYTLSPYFPAAKLQERRQE